MCVTLQSDATIVGREPPKLLDESGRSHLPSATNRRTSGDENLHAGSAAQNVKPKPTVQADAHKSTWREAAATGEKSLGTAHHYHCPTTLMGHWQNVFSERTVARGVALE
jgi:hypothetical protein